MMWQAARESRGIGADDGTHRLPLITQALRHDCAAGMQLWLQLCHRQQAALRSWPHGLLAAAPGGSTAHLGGAATPSRAGAPSSSMMYRKGGLPFAVLQLQGKRAQQAQAGLARRRWRRRRQKPGQPAASEPLAAGCRWERAGAQRHGMRDATGGAGGQGIWEANGVAQAGRGRAERRPPLTGAAGARWRCHRQLRPLRRRGRLPWVYKDVMWGRH